MKIRLCYRVEKEAGWGEDEYGNPTEVYSCVKVNCTASQFKIDENIITPITLNEYLDHVDEED